MKIRKCSVMFAVMLMTLSAVMVISTPTSGDAPIAPVWANERYFHGFIANLDAVNYNDAVYGIEDMNTTIQVSGLNTNATPPNDGLGPYIANWPADWNTNTMEFTLEFTRFDLHDHSVPFIFQLVDRYGYNETGGGIYNMPVPWVFWQSTPLPYNIPNGTLEFIPGELGNLALTVYNGSSGEPLEGVEFNFPKHPPFNSARSDLRTDASGNVVFYGLQTGIDNPENNITVNFVKEHFNTPNGFGYERFVISEDQTESYGITLIEDPLVKSFSPSDGATKVESNKTKTNIFVIFDDPMSKGTINQNTVWLEKEGGGNVPLSYSWNPSGDLVYLIPQQDLEYNTKYNIYVTPRVQNETGTEILWRTFTSSFTTHVKPGFIYGTVLINGTMDPAPDGSLYNIDSNFKEELVDGQFNVTIESDGAHTIYVFGPTATYTGGSIDQYLYFGDPQGVDFTIQRGDELLIEGLVLNKHPVRTIEFHVMNEDEEPMEGVTITNQFTMESLVTDALGMVDFPDIRKDITTQFRATYPNYDDKQFQVFPEDEDRTVRNVTMVENNLPIDIKARGRTVDIDLIPGSPPPIIDVESNFILDFKVNMNIDTMNSDNIYIIGPGAVSVPVDIYNETGYKRWYVDPRSDLEYNKDYSLVVKEDVADQSGLNPLWRDVTVHFKTESLDSAAVNGRVMVNEKPVGGISVKVMQGGNVLGQDLTTNNGYYLVDIPMEQVELTGVSVIANGTELGLSVNEIPGKKLISGGSLNNTDFELERLPDWFSVFYPKDWKGRMVPGGNIQLTFSKELNHNDISTFVENFTLRSTVKEEIAVNISEDGKVVMINPVQDLDFDQDYVLSVSDFPDGEFDRELIAADGLPALVRGEKIEIRTSLLPVTITLQTPPQADIENDEVKTDQEITLFFSPYEVNETMIEAAFQLYNAETEEPVGNIEFDWQNPGRRVEITHDEFESVTEYYILIESGEYGANGARIETDFLVYFTTINVLDRDLEPFPELPSDAQRAGPLTVTVTNDAGYPIKVVVYIKLESQDDSEYDELVTINLALGEQKQVDLDFTDFEYGNYKLLIEVYHASKDVLKNEYTRNLLLGEQPDVNGGGLDWWIWIIIGIFVLIIAALVVFLYTQSKKRDIEEELKEEFECPECNHLVSADDTVCPHCGAEFEEEAYKCPKCGNMMDPDDEECSECGYDFSDQESMELEDEEDEEMSDQYELDEEEEAEEEEEMEMEDEEEDMEELEEEEED
ncbi:MAG: Ig-like domain-containing protein [Thermoplasmatota archaeon]